MAKSCGAPQPGVDRFSYPLHITGMILQVAQLGIVAWGMTRLIMV